MTNDWCPSDWIIPVIRRKGSAFVGIIVPVGAGVWLVREACMACGYIIARAYREAPIKIIARTLITANGCFFFTALLLKNVSKLHCLNYIENVLLLKQNGTITLRRLPVPTRPCCSALLHA